MDLVSSEEMRRMDAFTIEKLGIPEMVLMENAGRAVAEEVLDLSRRLWPQKERTRWLILTGKGNQRRGRHGGGPPSCERGSGTRPGSCVRPGTVRRFRRLQKEIANRLGLRQLHYTREAVMWNEFDGIVDALLGTGSRGAPGDRTPMRSGRRSKAACRSWPSTFRAG